MLDIRAFRSAFYHLLTSRLSQNQMHDFNSFVDNLFGHFDKDANGLVDFRELVAGLSVMCAGTGEDKVCSAMWSRAFKMLSRIFFKHFRIFSVLLAHEGPFGFQLIRYEWGWFHLF